MAPDSTARRNSVAQSMLAANRPIAVSRTSLSRSLHATITVAASCGSRRTARVSKAATARAGSRIRPRNVVIDSSSSEYLKSSTAVRRSEIPVSAEAAIVAASLRIGSKRSATFCSTLPPAASAPCANAPTKRKRSAAELASALFQTASQASSSPICPINSAICPATDASPILANACLASCGVRNPLSKAAVIHGSSNEGEATMASSVSTLSGLSPAPTAKAFSKATLGVGSSQCSLSSRYSSFHAPRCHNKRCAVVRCQPFSCSNKATNISSLAELNLGGTRL